jgi:hypothetical protein
MIIPHRLKGRSTMLEVGVIWSIDRYGHDFLCHLEDSAAASLRISPKKDKSMSPSSPSSSLLVLDLNFYLLI